MYVLYYYLVSLAPIRCTFKFLNNYLAFFSLVGWHNIFIIAVVAMIVSLFFPSFMCHDNSLI